MIKEILSELGLSEKETAVFEKVLEYGKLSPARVSTLTDINRTTVYAVAKDLVQKGFLYEDALKGMTYYSPASAKDLVKITKKERQALVNKELLLEELAKEVQEIPRSKTYAVPKIKFIEGEEKVEQFLYDNTMEWIRGYEHSGWTWYGFQDNTLVAHEPYVEWIDWYWKQVPEVFDLKLLTNDSEAERLMQEANYPRRHMKFWNKNVDFTVTQWIVGEYTIMMQTKEKPHYLVEIHDAVYTRNMRELFKNLWGEIK